MAAIPRALLPTLAPNRKVSPVTDRTSLLILSFSPIARDARVLKQVAHFSSRFEVITCGYEAAPDGVSSHIQIPDELLSWRLNKPLTMSRQFEKAYWRQEVVAWARKALTGVHPDLVIANDVESVPLALSLVPAERIHADLHEYSPRQKEDVRRWRYFVAPYFRHLTKRYVTQVPSVTTVGEGLAREYEREFGVQAEVVTNASPHHDLAPSAVAATGPLRVVHSGAAMPDRQLEVMIDAASQVDGITFDLYLARNTPTYIDELRAQAAEVGGDRIRVLDPVPYSELIATLNRYDIGFYSIPPVSFNQKFSLPNKFFDFIQARLALGIGPSVEMKSIVERHGLGLVASDFHAEALAEMLRHFTPEAVAEFKNASHAHARELSAESQIAVWDRKITSLASHLPGASA